MSSSSAPIITVMVIATAIILIALIVRPHYEPVTVFTVVDASDSVSKWQALYSVCIKLILGVFQKDDKLVLSAMAKTTWTVEEYAKLPLISQIKLKEEVAKCRNVIGTYPALAMIHARDYAQKHPEEKIFVIFLTDGENSDPTGSCGASFSRECKNLLECSNIVAIGVFGNNDNRDTWSGFLHNLKIPIVIRGTQNIPDGMRTLVSFRPEKKG